MDALVFVAENGWKLMPQYIMNNETGEWRHKTHLTFKDRKWLGHITYKDGKFDNRSPIADDDISSIGTYILNRSTLHTFDFEINVMSFHGKMFVNENIKIIVTLPDSH